MSVFELDARLAEDCIVVGSLDLSLLLLMNNALLPWLILVPKCQETELTDLSSADQARVLAEINLLSGFLQNNYPGCKLNIAAIGNVVSQLHVHVIARQTDDFCWPDVVWGRAERKVYSTAEVDRFTRLIQDQLDINQR